MVRRDDPKCAGEYWIDSMGGRYPTDTSMKSWLETTYFISLQRTPETAIPPQVTVNFN